MTRRDDEIEAQTEDEAAAAVVTRARSGLAGVIGATVLSSGGSVFLADVVMGQLVEQQAAHIATLERAASDCARVADRCDGRLEACQERTRELRARFPE